MKQLYCRNRSTEYIKFILKAAWYRFMRQHTPSNAV